MEKVANSWWMYLLGVIVVIFVLGGSLFFILKSVKYKLLVPFNLPTSISL